MASAPSALDKRQAGERSRIRQPATGMAGPCALRTNSGRRIGAPFAQPATGMAGPCALRTNARTESGPAFGPLAARVAGFRAPRTNGGQGQRGGVPSIDGQHGPPSCGSDELQKGEWGRSRQMDGKRGGPSCGSDEWRCRRRARARRAGDESGEPRRGSDKWRWQESGAALGRPAAARRAFVRFGRLALAGSSSSRPVPRRTRAAGEPRCGSDKWRGAGAGRSRPADRPRAREGCARFGQMALGENGIAFGRLAAGAASLRAHRTTGEQERQGRVRRVDGQRGDPSGGSGERAPRPAPSCRRGGGAHEVSDRMVRRRASPRRAGRRRARRSRR